MSWTQLRISPGVVRNNTRYAVSGAWFDVSLVRFRDGLPEKWAGWTDRYSGFKFNGVCRSLHRHGTLNGQRWVSLGTSERFYMATDGAQYDVTPLLAEVTVPNCLSSYQIGSKVVFVQQTNHGRYPGDRVILSGVTTTVGGIPTSDFNGVEFTIVDWVSPNSYTIRSTTAASSVQASVGGAGVKLTYPFRPGSDDAIEGGGWGALGWSEEEWGGDYDGPVSSGGTVAFGAFDQMGIWTQDNWGEDLVANAQSGPIFYWDASFASNRMVDILDLPGADGHAPSEAQFVVISHRDRHCLAFGCTRYDDPTIVEPMTVRWCNQEDIYNWDEGLLDTGTAGNLPLSNGSRFIAAQATAREILVWSDQALYSIQYVGNPYIYTAELLERWSDICGLKAVTSFNGMVYWMGQGGFYAYSGRTDKIPCPIWDYISVRLNRDQMSKVYASSNQLHNEVLFFYPSNEGGNLEVDSYAAFDVVQQVWTFGSLARTAWMDLTALDPVIATSARPDLRVYEHDSGSDDGSTAPASPINAFIESGPIELSSEGSFDKGDRFAFIRRILPDVTFRDITTSSDVPQMLLTIRMMDKPGGDFLSTEQSSSPVARSVTIPVERFTEEAFVRLRGRSLTLRAESNTLGTNWRMGVPRIDVRTDGQR
jgi:hypothetical protein